MTVPREIFQLIFEFYWSHLQIQSNILTTVEADHLINLLDINMTHQHFMAQKDI